MTALYVAAAGMLVLVAIAAFVSPAGAWPLAAAGVFLVLIANLDRVSEVSAGTSGFSAKMREAQSRIEEMKEMIELMSSLQLRLLQQTGRWGTTSDEQKEAFLAKFVALMSDAGIPAARIHEIKDEAWDKFVMFDYVHHILGGGMLPKTGDAAEKAWRTLTKFEDIPPPSRVAAFLQMYGDGDPKRQQMLEAYEYYRENRQHIDLEIWKKRSEIPQIQARPTDSPTSVDR